MKRAVLLWLTAAILVSGSAQASSILNSAVWDLNGHTYYLIEFDADSDQLWVTARSDVRATLGPGFRLAAITSADEDAFVRALLEGRGWEWWIGGYQRPITEPEAVVGWTWLTGEAFGYQNWCGGEPNDANVPGFEQHLALDFGGACWNDEGSAISLVRGYVAETYAGSDVAEPGTLALLGLGLAGLGLSRRRKAN